MTAVTIERCTLTIVRHGGWSWGADAPDLARKAIAWLPLLLARYLADLRVGDEEWNLRAPVRVTVPLYLSELVAAPPATADPDSALPQALQGLAGRLQAALQPVLAAHAPGGDLSYGGRPREAPTAQGDSRQPPAVIVQPPIRQPLQSLWPLLHFWYERGMLPHLLAAGAPRTRDFWHRLISTAPSSPTRPLIADVGREDSQPDEPAAGVTRRPGNPAETESQADRLYAALGEVLASHGVSRGLREPDPRSAPAVQERRQPGPEAIPQPLQHLWPQLVLWHERGALPQFLAGASPQSLDFWHRLVLATLPGPDPEGEVEKLGASASETFAGDVTNSLVDAEPRMAGGHRPATELAQFVRKTRALRIFLVVAAASRLGVAPTDPILRGILDWAHPLDTSPPTGASENEAPTGDDALAPTPADRATAPNDATPHAALRARPPRGGPVAKVHPAPMPWQGEIDIPCVLPFLLLPSLSRLGYMEALAALLGSTALSGAAPLFAAALAFKVLPPPGRGWLRTPAQVRTASVFAGLREPVDQAELAEFARQWAGLGDVLDGVLAMSLIKGHRVGKPLSIQKWRERYLVLDSEGLFPIALGPPQRLAPVLGALPGEVVLIPADCFDAELKRVLEERGTAWITAAPPVRGERVRALQADGMRYYSNDRHRDDAALCALARALPPLAELGLELTGELLVKRPALPPNADDELEGHLFLAAACALGDMAWTLWPETTSPVPALTRFGDMDARVRFGAETVTVHLPMGRRYLDLYRHDLLRDVAHVPWLHGRLLQFRGG